MAENVFVCIMWTYTKHKTGTIRDLGAKQNNNQHVVNNKANVPSRLQWLNLFTPFNI